MTRILYCFYQVVVVLPLGLIATIVTALTTIIGCAIGNATTWGYYPGKLWSMFLIRIALLPVSVTGREHLQKHQSYVFCSNHQGAFDIFLIYGFLGRNFKWMMKQSLRNIPLVGKACEMAGFIFIDQHKRGNIKHAYEHARATLKDGMSLVVFPEGRRTFTGKMGVYKRGAFVLADELQLPVVPITINGSYEVLPRTHDISFLHRQPLRLIIHEPIYPVSQGADNLQRMEELSREATYNALEERYK